MSDKFSVPLSVIIKEFSLESVFLPEPAEKISITENEVTRPGLQLMGFYEYFNSERIQIIGKMEFAYMATIDAKTRRQRLDLFFSKSIPVIIISRGLEPYPEMIELAEKYSVPLLRTDESTSTFLASLIAFLNLNRFTIIDSLIN